MSTDNDTSPEVCWVGEMPLAGPATNGTCDAAVRYRDVPFRCSRDAGHVGRHLSCGVRTLYIAWPGADEPTAEEITAVTS